MAMRQQVAATLARLARPLFPLLPSNLRLYVRGRLGFSRYDPDAQVALRRLVRPGDVVFDVGANIGEIATFLSRLVEPGGRVVAFEANPACLPRLRRMLRLSRAGNVRVVHAGVGEHGARRLRIYSDDRPGASFKMSSRDAAWLPATGPRRAFDVPALALDDFCAHSRLSPSLVKIDVEGGEREVLLGFEAGLAADRPHLLLEQRTLCPGERDTALHLVEAAGYRLALPNPWRWLTADEFCAVERFETCIVAIHRDRAAVAAGWVA